VVEGDGEKEDHVEPYSYGQNCIYSRYNEEFHIVKSIIYTSL
jgi:hypothetical protein